MAQAMINFRMDAEEKCSFEEICKELGVTVTGALRMFAKKVIREKKVPFNVAVEEEKNDLFWSEENQARLREPIRQIAEGKFSQHELIEVD